MLPRDLFDLTLILGLAAGGLAALVRIFAKHYLPRWMSIDAPLGCPTCSAGWSVLALVVLADWFPTDALATIDESSLVAVALGAVAIGAVVNGYLVKVPIPDL